MENQVPQKSYGFTKQQKHALKAQILSLKRFKKNIFTLPQELLKAIVPPPLEVRAQIIFFGTGSEDNAKDSPKFTDSNDKNTTIGELPIGSDNHEDGSYVEEEAIPFVEKCASKIIVHDALPMDVEKDIASHVAAIDQVEKPTQEATTPQAKDVNTIQIACNEGVINCHEGMLQELPKRKDDDRKDKLKGIVANKMGLGKMGQVKALIAHLTIFEEYYGPHLIITSNVVIVSRKSELPTRFPPPSCIFCVGTEHTQSKLFSKRGGALNLSAFTTAYEFIRHDFPKPPKVDWKYFIIDEVQKLKGKKYVLARDFDKRKAFHNWFSKPFKREGIG